MVYLIQLLYRIRKLGTSIVIIRIDFLQCTTDLPIKPINRYRLINRIGKSEKLQYRIRIGSADYWAQYRLIGFGSKKRLV